jgi:hypothetical protein
MSASSFQAFRDNLRVSNSEDISAKYAAITLRLNRDFYESESETTHRLQVGSYGRSTAINGVSDLDMIFELPWSVHARLNRVEGNGPSQLFQDVRTSLLKRYPGTNIRGDGQVVILDFKGFRVEVLPAFRNADDSFTFGDSNNGGCWKTCKPIAEMNAFASLDTATNRNLRHVCKMLRSWKTTHGVPMGGMLIDTLTFNFFKSNRTYNDKAYASYAELMVDVFNYLANQNDQAYWSAPGSNQQIKSKGRFQTKARRAAAWCQEALDAETLAKKEKLWRKTFGRAFPRAQIATMGEAAAFRDTEQFIENAYPMDIQHEVVLDADVKKAGVVEVALRQLIGLGGSVRAGRTVKFVVSSCTVPKPYLIKWKVRNVGSEANSRDCIRGQIFDDDGNATHSEPTAFDGKHFVECYIIKDGYCVARDRIPVPISGCRHWAPP